jgi:hypothetical protein
LSDLAQAGQVLTTRKTFWRVRTTMAGVSLGPINVKGFTQPIELVILGTRLPGGGEALMIDTRVRDLVARVVEDPGYRARLLTAPALAARILAEEKLSDDEFRLARQVAILSGYPLFQAIPAGETAMLVARSRIEEYSESTIVVQQGAQEEGQFYIILQGDVVITAMDPHGEERHVASLARGEHFGEVALLFDTPRTATVRAGSPTALLAVSQEDFYSVLSNAPTLRERIETTARSRMGAPLSVRLPSATVARSAAR